MMTNTQPHFLEANGWFVLLWDDFYNTRNHGARLLLESPVKYWATDPLGKERPIPYGNAEQPAWGELMKRLRPSSNRLVPLAFAAILSPDGSVFEDEYETYESIEKWMVAKGYPPEHVNVVAHAGTEHSSFNGRGGGQLPLEFSPF